MFQQRPHRSVLVGALLFLSAGLVGCLAPEEFLPLTAGETDPDSGRVRWDESAPDEDQDGLADDAELAMGTDPLAPDSDGDGWGDGDEVAAGTNPLWDAHHPFAHGGYRTAPCPNPPETSGAGPTGKTQRDQDGTVVAYASYLPGDLVGDVALVDEWGQRVTLWNACGLTVWLIVADEDSPELPQAVVQLASLWARHQAYTWTPLLVLRQGYDGAIPDAERLATWRESFGLSGVPVVAPASDAQRANLAAFDLDGQDPSTSVLGQDLRALSVDDRVGLSGGDDVGDWLVD